MTHKGWCVIKEQKKKKKKNYCFAQNKSREYPLDIDHEIFSMVILSLPLIQEGQFSVSGERMSTSTGKSLNGVNWIIKLQTKSNQKPKYWDN